VKLMKGEIQAVESHEGEPAKKMVGCTRRKQRKAERDIFEKGNHEKEVPALGELIAFRSGGITVRGWVKSKRPVPRPPSKV